MDNHKLFITLLQEIYTLRSSSITSLSTDKICKVESLLQTESWKEITDSVTEISYQNILASIEIKNILVNMQLKCLFIHGSSAKGNARIAPNIATIKELDSNSFYGLRCQVLSEIRDDLDLIAIYEDSIPDIEMIKINLQVISTKFGCDITLNLVPLNNFIEELTDNIGSPAVRRILLFNSPCTLIGVSSVNELKALALKHISSFDYIHESDFKALMSLAILLEKRNLKEIFFDHISLLAAFPSIGYAYNNNIHIGFPKERYKLTAKPMV